MDIDHIVPLVEHVVAEQKDERESSFFSYRHSQEIHALGLKHEFPWESPWSQVCVSVVITAALTPMIWVRILWSRPKLEYPKEESMPLEFPLSDVGVRMFAREWPAIRERLGQAIARGRPPEKPNQSLQPTAPSGRG